MEAVTVKIDAGKVVGKMKPMHGIGQPPMTVVPVNVGETDRLVRLDVGGFPTKDARVCRMSETYRYAKTGEDFGTGNFMIHANECFEMELFDLE